MSIPIELQRAATLLMIADDCIKINLRPRDLTTKSSTGGQYQEPQSPRDQQMFKLIPMTHTQKSTVTIAGRERIIDFTLMGMWDAVIEVGDYWIGDDGRRYEVVALAPGHGYETKALVESHG